MVRLMLLIGGLCAMCSLGWAEDDVSIHCMAVGNRILEVQENRQLTFRSDGNADCPTISPNGKTIAYLLNRDKSTSLCLVRSSGGKPTAVLSGPTEPEFPNTEQREAKGQLWSLGSGSVEWSPDGKLMVVRGIRCAWDGKKETQTDCALVLTANGEYVRTFELPESVLRLCPSSNAIVATQAHRDAPNGESEHTKIASDLIIFDIANGSIRKIDLGRGVAYFKRWTDNGQALLYTCMSKGEHSLKKAWLDGKQIETISAKIDINTDVSPDGRFQVDIGDDEVTIRDIQAGKIIRTLKGPSVMPTTWSPNSSMLLYSQSLSVKDAAEQISRELSSLWATTMSPGKMGTMCIVPEFDEDNSVSCSRDGLRIAYTFGGRLYVAELGFRNPTASESKAAGLPLTEENIKELVAGNADYVAAALLSLAADSGEFPSAASIEERLKAELKDLEVPDALFMPGTQRSIFTFHDPGVKFGEIKDKGKTLIGDLDAGYAWKVLIYANSNTKIVDK